jgi:hypothetical protein
MKHSVGRRIILVGVWIAIGGMAAYLAGIIASKPVTARARVVVVTSADGSWVLSSTSGLFGDSVVGVECASSEAADRVARLFEGESRTQREAMTIQETPAWMGLSRHVANEPYKRLRSFAGGVPLRCVSGSLYSTPGGAVIGDAGIVVLGGVPWPVKPRIGPLCVDATGTGIVLWGILRLTVAGLGSTRRWIRRSNDECEQCGYPLRGLRKCPECGCPVQ